MIKPFLGTHRAHDGARSAPHSAQISRSEKRWRRTRVDITHRALTSRGDAPPSKRQVASSQIPRVSHSPHCSARLRQRLRARAGACSPPSSTFAATRATAFTAARARKKPPNRAASQRKNRRRPTLPGPRGPSTIGAEGLNFSVRNGKRCFPLAIATGNFARPRAGVVLATVPEGLENCTRRRRR